MRTNSLMLFNDLRARSPEKAVNVGAIMCLTKSPTKRTQEQHLKSRKFNKFMSIIILNDSIILERCVYAFGNYREL